MGIFNFLKKKTKNTGNNGYDNYVIERKLLSVNSFASFTNMFSEHHVFQTEKMMKVWDTFFSIAMCGYCSNLDNIIDKPNEYRSLKESIGKQFSKGPEILDDYKNFIKIKDGKGRDIAQLTSFWFLRNFQVYTNTEQRKVTESLNFLNIINLFLRSAYNNKNANFPNYISTTFTGDLKTESGAAEYVKLMELYCEKTFNLIKETLEN